MPEKNEIRKLEKAIDERTADIKNALETKYKINDAESFEKLYEASLPLIQLSMLPTEVLVLDPYADNNKGVSNTIGLGSFYYPVNGDATSTDWELASNHFKKQGAHTISAEQALDLANGWYRHMDYGGVYKQMFKLLKDAELNPREFAAVATVMYNSKKSGKILCDFVFMDPPYNKNLVNETMSSLEKFNILAPDAIIICETSSSEIISKSDRFDIFKTKLYNRIMINYAKER